MQQIDVSEVNHGVAAVPPDVLRALGVSNGDKLVFVKDDDGSISLMKAPAPSVVKRPISDIIGVFSTGEQRSLDEELALLRDIRYGDELDDRTADLTAKWTPLPVSRHSGRAARNCRRSRSMTPGRRPSVTVVAEPNEAPTSMPMCAIV